MPSMRRWKKRAEASMREMRLPAPASVKDEYANFDAMCERARSFTPGGDAFDRARAFIHETPLSLCGVWADTCPDGFLALSLLRLVKCPVRRCDRFVGHVGDCTSDGNGRYG